MSVINGQAAEEQSRRERRLIWIMQLLPALATTLTVGLSPTFAQVIPNREVPAVTPAPPPKVVIPPAVPRKQYDCPTGYAKPDELLRIQNIRICLPVGSAGTAPSAIPSTPPVGTPMAIPNQSPSRASSSAAFTPPRITTISSGSGTKSSGRTFPACDGRTGFYACGRNASECCALTQDNPCFAGAYACKIDASQGGPNSVCCLK